MTTIENDKLEKSHLKWQPTTHYNLVAPKGISMVQIEDSCVNNTLSTDKLIIMWGPRNK